MLSPSRIANATPSRRLMPRGKIIFNNRSSTFDCAIQEMSAERAVLKMPSTLGVPKVFHLRLHPSTTEHLCQIEWRTGDSIAVTISSAHPTVS